MTNLRDIEGIGPAFASALEAIGINSVEELLTQGAHTKDRERIAAQSGLTYSQILEWVNRADLARINGIGSEYADLLEAAGVDTVIELAKRRADNLTVKLAETNQEKNLVRRVPTEAEVTDWIAQAKELPRAVWYEARSRARAVTGAADATVLSDATAATVAAAESGPEKALRDDDTISMPIVPMEEEPAAVNADAEPPTTTPPAAATVTPEPSGVATTVAAAGMAGLVAGGVGGTAGIAGTSPQEATGAAEPVVPRPEPVRVTDTPVTPAPPADAASSGSTPSPPEWRSARVTPVTPAATPSDNEHRSGLVWLWPLLALLGLGILYFAWPRGPRGGEEPIPRTIPAPSVPATPGDTAVVLPDRKPEDIVMLCEKGAQEWLTKAADSFNKQPNTGGMRILLASLGSREGRDHILYDKQKVHPTIWNPADMYWVDKLQSDVADQNLPNKSGANVESGQPILKTYLVLAMREDRAKVFEKAMATDAYKGKTWALLNDLATKGWNAPGVGGDPAWGKLKLAQTDPTKSNSGMTALALMYAEFQRANPTKDYNSPEFKTWLGNLEGTITAFPDSTTDAVKAFLDKPTDYDAVVCYESDIIKAVEGGAKGIRVLYPSPTATVVLPAAVVTASWVTEAQAKRANDFIGYLTSPTMQEEAVKFGYRPASDQLIGVVTPAFEAPARKAVGMVAAPTLEEDTPDTKTKEGLIFVWDQWKKGK